MSARAACRLTMLGFTDIHRYMPGKADWIANALPIEGEWNQAETAGALARSDVATCKIDDPAGVVRQRIAGSPYGFALVLSDEGVLLGRIRGSVLSEAGDGAVAEMMEPGPSTVRAHTEASALTKRLHDEELTTAVVTTPGGRLIGVVTLEALEAI